MISGVPYMVIVNFNKCLSYSISVFGFEWAKMQISTEYVSHRQNVFIGFIFYCDGYATHVYQVHLISFLHSFNSNWFQKNAFEENRNNPKATWNTIKTLTGSGKMNKGISKLQLDGKAVENATEIAEQFNSYFSSIADNLRSGLG